MAAGAIPVKYKELLALAVAFTTQCPYCIEIHAGRAREAGASNEEISETVVIAAALRAGAAITHGTHALKAASSAFRIPQVARICTRAASCARGVGRICLRNGASGLSDLPRQRLESG